MRLNQKIAVLALATSAAVASFSAQAASVDINVIGTITPGSCTPTLAGGGTIDYGTILAGQVSPSNFTVLFEKAVAFTITCSAPAKVAIKTLDNRASSVIPGAAEEALEVALKDDYNFGLGTASGVNVGGYIIRANSPDFTADSVRVVPIEQLGPDLWEAPGVIALPKTTLLSWASAGGSVPVAFSTLTGTLFVQAFLNKGSELELSGDITLDGSATIELVYL